MSKFKKMNETASHAYLVTDDGHEVAVAKKALNRATKKKIAEMPMHMLQGGEVQDLMKVQLDDAALLDAQGLPQVRLEDPYGMPKVMLEGQAPVQMAAAPVQGSFLPSFSPESYAQSAVADQMAPLVQEAPAAERSLASTPQADLAPAKPQFVAPVIQAQEQAPMANVPGVPEQMASAGMSPMQIVGGYQAAQSQLARAQEQEAAAKARIMEDDLAESNAMQSLYEANALRAKNIMDQIGSANSEVDPDRYLKNMSTGQRILSMVGLIVGGLGGSLKPVEFLQKQIDNDIEAQKANLGKKQTQLGHLISVLGDQREAINQLRMIKTDMVKRKLERAGELAKGPMAKANAMAAVAELKKSVFDNAQNYVREKTANEHLGYMSGNPKNLEVALSKLDVTDPKMAENARKRYVPGENRLASTDVDRMTRDRFAAHKDFNDKIEQLQKFADASAVRKLDPRETEYAKSLARDFIMTYKTAKQLGALAQYELDLAREAIPQDPTAYLSKLRTNPQYRALKQANLGEWNAIRSQYGFDPVRNTTSMYREIPGFNK